MKREGEGSTSEATAPTSTLVDTPRDHRTAALLLAAVAGCADAVGFLGLSGLYPSFMSANFVRAGLALQDRTWATAGLAMGYVLLFAGGVAAGTLVATRLRQGRAGLLMLVAAALIAASGWLGVRTGQISVPALVIAMGVLNTVFPGLGVTYVTGAVVRIGRAIGGDSSQAEDFGANLALCLAFAGGVLAGAALWPVYGGQLFWGLAGLLGLAGIVHFLPGLRDL